ncbi:olfactory receptor 5V1-like [Dendropsophus ebraccatus]|uniref:olfactory receptor 5V1-like n=1 Tax=Dendropsophus ebraccatus TaxID=150705 RepID=UPI003831E829
MEQQLNQTTSYRFILLGLSNDPHLQVIFFTIFLIMYVITISGNFLLTTIVCISPTLHSPMFFFLTNLSIIDIFFSSSIVPVLLMNTLLADRSISLLGCATQMYFSLALGTTESLILGVMAYDRFAAICRPLHYNTIMKMTFCFYLAAGSWSVAFINSFVQAVLTFQLQFCNYRNLNNYFCEVPAFIRMSCGDTFLNELSIYITGTLLAMCSFYVIVISYIHIIVKILKIISSEGRQKAFSTCASHFTVVFLFFGTVMCMYLRPHSKYYTSKADRVVPLLYTTVIPTLNPFIYSIRNKDVKNSVISQFKRKNLY